MSFNFAIKDMYNFKEQTKSHIKATSAVIALSVLYLNIVRSMGLLFLPDSINLYTYTILELFSQYNLFLIILTYFLAIFVVITSNHALIQSRKKDIAVMKALGTLPRSLYSFYLTELLILVFITFFIGLVIGYLLFFLFFIIFRGESWISLSWLPDKFYIWILGGLLLFTTFMINGYGIRKIGQKTYTETKTGKINETIHAKLNPFWKKVLKNRTISLKLSIKNLYRKRYEFKESIIMIAISAMIMFTGIIGVYIVGNSSVNYINSAQGEYIITLGASPVVDAFQLSYESFSDENLNLENADIESEGSYISFQYNLTEFEPELRNYLKTKNVNSLETRLFLIQTIYEQQGYIITNTETLNVTHQYQLIGEGKNNRTIPIQGINFVNSTQNWYSAEVELNSSTIVAIGDTLAGELYENALLQRISIINNETQKEHFHHIDAIVVDSLNNGNNLYVEKSRLQNDLGRENYINLVLIDYSKLVENENEKEMLTEEFLLSLNNFLNDTLGDQFKAIDLHPVFQQNLKSIASNQMVTSSFSIIMACIIIYTIYYYQKGRIHEEEKDFIIMKALGGKIRDIRNTIYYEQLFKLTIGLLIGLIGSMVILIFFLMENSQFPSIFIPIGSFFAAISVFYLFSYITSNIVVKRYSKKLNCLHL